LPDVGSQLDEKALGNCLDEPGRLQFEINAQAMRFSGALPLPPRQNQQAW